MITISLSLDFDGKLYGTTTSDQWNLETLGFAHLEYNANQKGVKRLRRALKRLGMSAEFRIVSNIMRPIRWALTPQEYDSLSIRRKVRAA